MEEEERRAIVHRRMRVFAAVVKYPPGLRRAVLSGEAAGLLDPSDLEELNSLIDRMPLLTDEAINWNVIPGSTVLECVEEENYYPVARSVLERFAKGDERVVVVWGSVCRAPCWITRDALDPLLEEIESVSYWIWLIKLEGREVLELGPESFSWGRLGSLTR